jgi:hypothetical protein
MEYGMLTNVPSHNTVGVTPRKGGPHLLDVRSRRDRVRLSDVVVADVHGHLPPPRNRDQRDQRLDACTKNTPPPFRTKWTRRVPHPVLIGHAASLA